MARVVFVRVGGTDECPHYAPEDASDLKALKGGDVILCDVKGTKALITALQMRSIHLYFKMLAEALNAAGLDMKAVMEKLSKNALIPWSASAIKERLWRPVMIDTFGKESTTQLETDEISVTYEALNNVTGSQLGVSIPFPDRYNQMIEQIGSK